MVYVARRKNLKSKRVVIRKSTTKPNGSEAQWKASQTNVCATMRKGVRMSEQFDEYDRYALFDIETHTIDALELVLEKMRQARERPTSWKWVVIGLHTAMHGGFALVLRRSDGAQLLDKKREQAVYESWERERETGTRESLHYDHLDWF